VADLILAGEVLASVWRERLTGMGPDLLSPDQLHETEAKRLTASDYTYVVDDQRTHNRRLRGPDAARHAYRQIAYAAMGLPCHPDAERVLTESLNDARKAT
jgi:hypothetical protein